MITVYGFKWLPPFVQGQSRDIRVRWALEEAGLAYEEKLLSFDEQKAEAFRAIQPFGQLPAYEEDGLVMFESGAILQHIAAKSPVLGPSDPAAWARMTCWLFAALNSIEPYLANLGNIDFFNADKEWARLYRPEALALAEQRIDVLADRLKDRDYVEDVFTAADLLIVTMLRNARGLGVLETRPVLEAYAERCEARPAFQRALASHLAPFAQNAPAT